MMRDERLNNVIRQYFPGQTLSCDIAESVVLEEARPIEMDEPDVQAKIIDLFDRGLILGTDHDRTVFNLVLPPGTVLRLGDSNSLHGLGGYHGSVHSFVMGSAEHFTTRPMLIPSVVETGQTAFRFFQSLGRTSFVPCTTN